MNLFLMFQLTICFFILVVLPAITFDDHMFGVGCHTKAAFSEDKYCVNSANYTNSRDWTIRSHEQDRINAEKRAAKKEQARLAKQEYEKCYDEGYFVNESFRVSDYFTCKQVEYLNDHLMDNFEKRKVGYVSGYYSGILSHGSISGETHQYINDRILATGKLVENINHQVDCNNEKQDERIDYFSEEEFVMHYVEECLK